MMKMELQVTQGGNIALAQDSGENVELVVLLPGSEYRMTLPSGTSAYVGCVEAKLKPGVLPQAATRLER